MGILFAAICLIAGLFQVSLPFQLLPEKGGVQRTFLVSSNPYTLPSGSVERFLSPLEEIIEKQCRSVPNGDGIPAFQPGISKSDVLQMLGVPSKTSQGYWPNTRAVSYELIPEQVSLGFLFDKHTERIRQTEASFTNGFDSQTVVLTLNGMLGCKLNEQIQQGLEQVWQRRSRQFSFRLDALEGVIEWQKRDRLYIGIWEADLH
jgi:serine/threonine-protein kinase